MKNHHIDVWLSGFANQGAVALSLTAAFLLDSISHPAWRRSEASLVRDSSEAAHLRPGRFY
jgi:hypothetical protein